MAFEVEDGRSRPLLLLGRQEQALAALARGPALRSCIVVATPRDVTVDALAASLRPIAILLEASEYYLRGRQVLAQLRGASPGSRVLFLDREGPWSLWMEVESEETGNLLISPCESERAGQALVELLDGAPARLETAA